MPANGYNGDDLRAWKQNSSEARTYFLYDGSQPVCELNGSGTLVAVNDFGADGVWARHEANSSYGVDWFYTFDPQGSVSQKVGRDGSVVCSSVHDAQGRQGTTDTHADPFSGFGGQWGYYADWETSQQGGWYCLCLLGHRFYDPGAGRFLNRDPIDYNGGINLYNYVGNNPVNDIDPEGYAKGDAQWCNRQKEKINNVRRRIQKRIGELHDDPQGLPESAPGESPSKSRGGHRMLINQDKALLNILELEYNTFCGGPKPPCPPTRVQDNDAIQEDPTLDNLLLAIFGGGFLRSPIRFPRPGPVRLPMPPMRGPILGPAH